MTDNDCCKALWVVGSTREALYTVNAVAPMFPLTPTILMQTAVSPVNPVQAAVVGGAKSLWFIDSEFLNEGKVDLFPAPFQSFYLLFTY